jgi:methionine aminopeptidase
MEYSEVQNIAKKTIEYVQTVIKPGMNLQHIRELCEGKMLELGADSFWYWDIGAFCFSGNETTISVSGKVYKTSERLIKENDIITIDLSPQHNDIWGDYARTIVLEDGKVVTNILDIIHSEWKAGLQMEEKLHEELKTFLTKATTFEELYFHINDFIDSNGYINLDFMGNLGHSIVKNKNDRIYIERGNKTKLSEVSLFTFEPHISILSSAYGYKKENIYYFNNGMLMEL